MTPPGVTEQYRGSDSTAVADAAMKFPKSYPEMLNITHTHLLGMAAIFAFSGLALALCERPSERWRKLLVVEPFVALWSPSPRCGSCATSTRGSAGCSTLSSGLMAVTFYVQSLLGAAGARRSAGRPAREAAYSWVPWAPGSRAPPRRGWLAGATALAGGEARSSWSAGRGRWAAGPPAAVGGVGSAPATSRRQAALAELRRVEDALSRFDETSDLSELNRRAGRRPQCGTRSGSRCSPRRSEFGRAHRRCVRPAIGR